MALRDPWDFSVNRPVPQGLFERSVLVSLAYDGDEAAIRSFLAPYGVVDDLRITHQPASWPPSWIMMRQGGSWEIAIAGTANRKQVLLHLGGVVGTQGRGGGSFVNGLHALIASDLWAIMRPIIDAAGDPERIAFSGHSYGAAVAELMALDAAGLYGPERIAVVTFGCPRWLAGPDLSPSPSIRVRVSAEDDPVPRLPPKGGTVAQIAAEFHVPLTRSYAAPWRHVGYLFRPAPPPAGVYSGEDAEEPSSVFAVAWLGPDTPHAAQTYVSRLNNLQGVGPVSVGQVAPVARAAMQPAPEGANVTLPKDQGIDLSATNRLYWHSDSGPITGPNITTWESVGLAAVAGGLLPPANIGHFPGGIMSTPSGFAKVVMCINNGRYGHKESHVIAQPYNSPAAAVAARQLCYMRQALLGGVNPDPTVAAKSLKSPAIEYAIITDPISYKLGTLLDFTEAPYLGQVANLPADTFFNALTVRMRARLTAGPGGAREFASNLQLVGCPDDAIVNAAFARVLNIGGNAYRALVDRYLQFLMGLDSSNMHWGAMGLSRTEPLVGITGWTLVGGVWTATTDRVHGYHPLDRVRITRCNPVFNGTWKIATVTDTTFTIRKQPVTGHTVPPPCQCIRVGLASGDRVLEFYPYYDVQHSGGGDTSIRVSKKNPGREYVGVSFNKRVRRER